MTKEVNEPEIKWLDKTVKVADLKPYENNPRTISGEDFDRVVESLKSVGQFETMTCTSDLRLINGHQRLKAFKKLGWETVRVSVPDCELTDKQFEEVLIRANVTNGQWDVDKLIEHHELDDMLTWGVDADVFPVEPDEIEEDDGAYVPNAIIQYNIIFDHEDQQKVWFDFIKKLRDDMPGQEITMAERIIGKISAIFRPSLYLDRHPSFKIPP